ARCNKREPGTGCDAIEGHHRNLAVLGTSEYCIASNPSDMNVALMALDATVHVQHRAGERAIPTREFYLLPGDAPHREAVLDRAEEIAYSGLTPLGEGTHTSYFKRRDRGSYGVGLASAAVVLRDRDGRIAKAGVALGGGGARSRHCPQAEQ